MAEAHILVDETKPMDSLINKEKTKYMILPRKNNRHNNLIVREHQIFRGGISFLGNNHKEIL